jgi:hypothetical protein
MKTVLLTLTLASVSLPSFGGEFWYFTYAREGSLGMKPEFSFSNVIQCENAPENGGRYGDFDYDSKNGPFKSQELADDALDRDIKRVQLADPNTKLIRKNAKCN